MIICYVFHLTQLIAQNKEERENNKKDRRRQERESQRQGGERTEQSEVGDAVQSESVSVG